MKEQRDLIISRTYRKATDICTLFVARVSGSDISGLVFQYEIWLSDQEQLEKRVTSGNKYVVRRAFIQSLLDLQEEGWERKGYATYENRSFFDPVEL